MNKEHLLLRLAGDKGKHAARVEELEKEEFRDVREEDELRDRKRMTTTLGDAMDYIRGQGVFQNMPEPTIPCKFCSSPISCFNGNLICSDCELRMHQEGQVP